MAKNTADATWNGSLKEGDGHMALGNGAFEGDFSFKSRFEDGEEGTNPEELIAAAHAGCFSMAFSNIMHSNGIESESVKTHAEVSMGQVDGSPGIKRIVLTTTVVAPGADEDAVREHGDAAKAGCPVSKALAGVPEIELELTIET